MVLPEESASTWNSTWRAAGMYCSKNTRPSPKAEAASRLADSRAGYKSCTRSTTRMPRPPPPAAAFTSKGNPISADMSSA